MGSNFIPKVVVIDYETALLTGQASVEYYRKDFRVESVAWSYRGEEGEIVSGFVEGEERVRILIAKLVEWRCQVWAHNLPFEMGVTMCRFPDLEGKLRWGGDTMRLVQNYDNGGRDYGNEQDIPLTFEQELDKQMAEMEGREWGAEKDKGYQKGLGLVASVRRLLPSKYHNHKDEAHNWIRENVKACGKKDNPAKFLNELPYDIMKRYNIGDTENTLRLYEFTTDHFSGIGFDWTIDHSLYMNSVRMIVNAKIAGAKINREDLAKVIEQVTEEIYSIENEFFERFSEEIKKVEHMRWEKWTSEPKTERGRLNRIKQVAADRQKSVRVKDDKNKYDKNVRFNVGSNKQLEQMFCEVMGMAAQFSTDKGNPSFKSCFLHQWGDGGLILAKRRKRLLVLKQAQSLYELSAYDGRWHMDLKACGTATGRFAGGSRV